MIGVLWSVKIFSFAALSFDTFVRVLGPHYPQLGTEKAVQAYRRWHRVFERRRYRFDRSQADHYEREMRRCFPGSFPEDDSLWEDENWQDWSRFMAWSGGISEPRPLEDPVLAEYSHPFQQSLAFQAITQRSY